MTVLIALGARLARAGGTFRMVAVGLGNLIGALLLLLAITLPHAIYPDPAARAAAMLYWGLAVAALVIPPAGLLVMAGRLSSGVRDRRLAALRIIGLTPAKAGVAAGAENAILAICGATIGSLLFAALAPAFESLSVAGFDRFPGGFRPGPLAVVVAILALTALSIAIGTAPTWNQDFGTGGRRDIATSKPRWWRAALLALAVTAYATLLIVPPNLARQGPRAVTYIIATGLGVLGIALITPAITGAVAAWWGRRTASVAVLLAARSAQADAASAGRVVAGLAVAVVLTTTALGLLGLVASGAVFARAIRAESAGPQVIVLEQPDGSVPPQAADAATIAELFAETPGVLGVAPRRFASTLPVRGSVLNPDDRALERRRNVARLAMVGVPPSSLVNK